MPDSHEKALRKLLRAPASLISGADAREDYSHDATFYSSPPRLVLVAESVDDVQAAVAYCHQHSIPITARGAGTGLSGGCVPASGALVISLERLVDLQIFPLEKTAVCGPGTITKDLVD
ncbi:MAG: FAD-binding oxidoreductase, partial [candidate division Zixibacteria bacterium]|nr:FAD-binding oxidoreductase [candidate division Zixibacteria bacterium]